jgi:hypothetical protein
MRLSRAKLIAVARGDLARVRAVVKGSRSDILILTLTVVKAAPVLEIVHAAAAAKLVHKGLAA